jgi:hypothetical protein
MSTKELIRRLYLDGTSTAKEAAEHIVKLEQTIENLVEEMGWAQPILVRYLTHPNDEAWLISFDEAIKKAKE